MDVYLYVPRSCCLVCGSRVISLKFFRSINNLFVLCVGIIKIQTKIKTNLNSPHGDDVQDLCCGICF